LIASQIATHVDTP